MIAQSLVAPVEAVDCSTARLRLIAPSSLTMLDRAAWDTLSASAEPGAFFSHRWFLEPLLDHPIRRLAVVEDKGQWLGLLAIEKTNRLWRFPVPVWAGLNDANQFLGVPLVRKGDARIFWRTLLTGLEADRSAPLGLYLPALPDDGPVVAALRRWCLNDGRRLERVRSTERAAFTGGQCFETFLANAISPKRRRRLASLARQLEDDVGPLRVEAAQGVESTAQWIDRFLMLECAGWKGIARSSMASDPATERLFRSAVAGAAARNMAQCLTLFAGDTPLAASVQFIDGEVGCGFKTCYDERYSRYAPGLQLLLHVTRTISAIPGLWFDSCCAHDQASINGLWPERRRISDYCVGLRGHGKDRLFDSVMAARRLWQRTKSAGV